MYPRRRELSDNRLHQQVVAAHERVRKLERELAIARADIKSLESQAWGTTDPETAKIPAVERHDANSSAVTASSSLEEKLELFSQRFQGRHDVYATRWVSRKTDTSGWSPAVLGGVPSAQKTEADFLPMTQRVLERHLRGSGQRWSEFHVGLYPLTTGHECKLLVCGFDGHAWEDDATSFVQACKEADIDSLAEISRSGNGAHVWIFFETWISASTARRAGMVLLRRAMHKNAGIALESYDRFFPAQDALPLQSSGRLQLGNLIALPLQGDCRRRGTTVFADPVTWEPYEDQFQALALTVPVPARVVADVATEHTTLAAGPTLSTAVPKRPERHELRTGLKGQTINIRRGAMLHIPTNDVPAAFISELKRRASIANPEFYRRQAQRFSTFGVPRVVTSFEYQDNELRLPRGLADDTRRLLKNAGAKVVIRNTGKRHKRREISFTGQLRPEQQEAVRALSNHQDGILIAPPGSGKTVMGCAMIAERRVATAILVNRTELLHQWREQVTALLGIEDHQIGQLGGGRKKRKGLVDLIMMQSVSGKGSDPTLLEDYGQIIIDECHSVAAPATVAALGTVNVKHWIGLTATPFRADKMDGLITMQCGPIRHEIVAETVEERHLLVHRTPFTTEKPGTDGPSIQAIYSELSVDSARNQIIADEIMKAAAVHRNCMVLTNRIDHLNALHALLKPHTPTEVFTLHGQLSVQERREARENIARSVHENRPFVLLAIDKLAGEGLDIPTMDTLFLTMPVSFKGRIIQQAGRVTRGSHEGQNAAVVHDFRDKKVPLLERMHRRRLKILEKEGFALQPQLPITSSLW